VGTSAIGIAAGVVTSILPLALDGESVSEGGGNGTLLAVLSLVSIIACYLVLFALWRWVFSANARERRRKGSPE
jgi:uncharacterized protein (DUF2062 family)